MSINQILSSLPKSYANYAPTAAAGGSSNTFASTIDPLTNSYTGPLGGTTTTTTTTNNITGTITKYNDNLLADPQQDLNDYYKLAGAKRTKLRTNYNRHYGLDESGAYLNPLYDTHSKYVPSYNDSKALISGLFDDKTYTEINNKANGGGKKSWFDEPCNQYVPLSKRSQMWRPKSPPRSFDERYRQSRRMSDQFAQSNLNPISKFSVQLTSQLPSHHQQLQQLQQQQQQQQQQMPSTLKDLESLNKRTTELISDLNRKFQSM